MAGYARQSSSSIADGETITAAPLNSEFDAVLAAFAFSGGHNHDGSSTEGSYVGILADVDALNKVVVDTSNNRHGFFVQVSSSAVEQIRIQDGAIVPVTSNDIDLGTSSLQYKDIHIDGTAYIDTLEIHVGASLSAGVLSLPDGSASAPVITNTGDTNQGLYFSGTDEMSFTAGGTAQVTFADGVIKPVTDNDVDLGTSSLQFKDIHINGTANIDTLAGTTMSGNLAMGSNKVTGLAAPSADGDAARKVYVDDSIASAEGLTQLAGNINVNGFHFFGSSGEDIKFKPVGSASILSTQDTDGEFVALVLRNESDAADTTGIASLRFDLEDTSGNTVDAAKIAVKKEASFTSTAATQDSSMVFSTSLNGTLTEYLKLTSAGILEPITDNTVDIGTSAKQIKDIYVHGTAYLDAIGFGTTSITLPTADGSANQILKTNGSGTLSFADDTGTTINNAAENRLVTVASTTTQVDGEANLTFDGTTLTLNGKLAMASNVAGTILIADGTDFEPTAVGDLSAVSSVASDDVLLIVDTSGGGLKKITRSTLVSGLATSSAISNIVEDTSPQLGGNLDAQDKSITDVGILGYSYGASGSPTVLTVTVASKTSGHPYNGDGSSSAYFLNGAEAPAINLNGVDSVTSSSGYYYKFDQADSSNSGHPLRFYLDAAKTIAYTTGVTTSGTPGTAGAHTTIAVTDQTPSTLYYQCSSHAYMGNYASVDSANITSSGAVSIDAVGDVTIDADGGDIVFKDAGTTFGSATNTSGDLIIKSGTTTALTFDGANATVAGNLVVTGNHTVNGTTTTVNSTTVTIDDPIFTLGGDGTPGSDDNKDRGIEFKYHTGSAAKVGFFGWDDSAGAFTFVPDATNSSEVFSGTVGNVIFGNIAGTLTTAAQTNITSVGALDAGSITSGFGAIDNGTSGIRTNTFTAETSVVPDASGGADLGSTSLEWGDLYIADDKKIYLGSDQNFSIEYDEDGNDTTAIVAANGVAFAPHGTGTGNGTELKFQELAANGANYVGFKAPDAIASNEVWVLPNADGSADQVLKTDGSNALAWVDQAGGGTVNMVADGAITAGKPVVLTSAGKAQQVAQTVAVASSPTKTAIVQPGAGGNANDTTDKAVSCVFDPSTDHFVLAYKDTSNNSGYGTIIAGKTSAITKSASGITLGTATVFESSVLHEQPHLSAGGNKVHVSYRDANGTGVVKSVAVTAGTSATEVGSAVHSFSSAFAPASAGEQRLSTSSAGTTAGIAYDTNTDRFLINYTDSSNYGTAVVAQLSNTATGAITYGTPVVYHSATTRLNPNNHAHFDSSTNRVGLIYIDQASNYDVQSLVATITGGTTNSVAFGAHERILSGTGNQEWSLVYDQNLNRFVAFGVRSNDFKAGVGYITGGTTNTFHWGSIETMNSGNTLFARMAVDTNNSGKALARYTTIDSQDRSRARVITFTGGTDNAISSGSQATIANGEYTNYGHMAFDPVNNRFLEAYTVSKESNVGYQRVLTYSGTNVSSGTRTQTGSFTGHTNSNTMYDHSILYAGGTSGQFYYTWRKGSGTDHKKFTIVDTDSSLNTSYTAYPDFLGDEDSEGTWSSPTMIIDPDSGKLAIAYADGSKPNMVMVNPSINPDPLGYHQAYDTANNYIHLVFSSGTSSFVLPIYYNSGTDAYTAGTASALISGAISTRESSILFDTDTNRSIVAYRDTENSDVGTANVIQSTGTAGSPTVTIGADATFDGTDNCADVSLAYDTANNKVFVAYVNTSDTKIRGSIGTITAGTNAVSFAGTADIYNYSSAPGGIDIAYDSDKGLIDLFARNADSSNQFGDMQITPAASSFSVSNSNAFTHIAQENTVGTGSAAYGAGFGTIVGVHSNGQSNKVGTQHRFYLKTITTNLDDGNFLGVAAAGISDTATGKITIFGGVNENQTSLTIGNHYFTNSEGVVGLSADAFGGRYLGHAIAADKIKMRKNEGYIYGISSNAVPRGNLMLVETNGTLTACSGSTTSVTEENFIGFATKSVDAGAQVEVATHGQIITLPFTTTSTELVTGQAYYSTAGGTISTTPSAIAVGRALSENQLLVGYQVHAN